MGLTTSGDRWYGESEHAVVGAVVGNAKALSIALI